MRGVLSESEEGGQSIAWESSLGTLDFKIGGTASADRSA